MTPPPVRDLPERVLIVRLGAIGDVANALVVATAIKEARPEVHIGWAVHELARPLVEGHPAVDRVHLWPRRSGLEGFQAFLGELRAERYGLALDLQRIFKSALVARLSHAPRVVGFDRKRAKEGSWMWTTERLPAGDGAAHMVVQYLEFPRYLGLRTRGPVHRFPAYPEAAAWAQDLVQELGQPPLVLNLGASKRPNRWPPERFGELGQRLVAEHGAPLCLTGGPDDRALAEDAREALGDTPARDLVGATDLPQLVELLRRARLVVSCDTGAMHLAAAVRTPVVALFGPAEPGRTGPWGADHRVVRAPGVSGAMSEIAVDVVVTAVREQLERLG